MYDPLAQSVEHLTFNQGVRDSSSRWVTNKTKGIAWRCLLFCWRNTMKPGPRNSRRQCTRAQERAGESELSAHAGIQRFRRVTKKAGAYRWPLLSFVCWMWENSSCCGVRFFCKKRQKNNEKISKNLLTKADSCAIIVKSWAPYVCWYSSVGRARHW